MNHHILIPIVVLVGSMSYAVELTDEYLFPTDGWHILPESLGTQMLRPRSRSAPKNVSAFWKPTDTQINDFESALRDYLKNRQTAGSPRPLAGSYNRQYIGIVRAGKRLIYGNFYPSKMFEDAPQYRYVESSRLVDMCDSRPDIWGVTFNPSTKAFSDLSFGFGL